MESSWSFAASEQRHLSSAFTELPAIAVIDRVTQSLAEVVEGTHVPPEPENAPPSYYVRSASLLLAVIALRTARACMLVVAAGYWPEAHGLKRRLSEVHARAQACADDTTGQQARQWLAGKPPKTGPIIHKFGSADLYDVYSWGAHADARSVQAWLAVPWPHVHEGHKALMVVPHHDQRLSNATLTEVAMECRDIYATHAIAREESREAAAKWHERLPAIDQEIAALIKQYYDPH